MQHHGQLPKYEEIEAILAPLKSVLSPAQIHGLLCGVICQGMDSLDEEASVAIAIGVSGQEVEMTEEQSQSLRVLLEYSYEQLSEMAFDFQLLLPEDEESLSFRSQELARWCDGFLLGLEASGAAHVEALNERLSADGYEILLRLTEISEMDETEVPESEENEESFMEVFEYVRMAILMLYSELHPAPHRRGSSSRVLH